MLKQLFTHRVSCLVLNHSFFEHQRFILNIASIRWMLSRRILQSKQNSLTFNFFSTRFISDRRYSEKHEWILLDPTDKMNGTVGISQYAQEALGDVVYVQLPEIDVEFNQNDEVGAIESVKAANEVYTPVSGKIIEINRKLEEKPGLINSSCYDEGWLFKIQIKDQTEVDGMMDEKSYEKFLKSLQ